MLRVVALVVVLAGVVVLRRRSLRPAGWQDWVAISAVIVASCVIAWG